MDISLQVVLECQRPITLCDWTLSRSTRSMVRSGVHTSLRTKEMTISLPFYWVAKPSRNLGFVSWFFLSLPCYVMSLWAESSACILVKCEAHDSMSFVSTWPFAVLARVRSTIVNKIW